MNIQFRATHLLTCLAFALPLAASANAVLDGYLAGTKGTFSAAAGEKLYRTVGPKHSLCASCHTDSPKNVGKLAKTNNAIDPMAPSVNPKRFTDAAWVEKWFKRNCNDALGRVCTTHENGDFVSYMLSLK